MYEINGVRVNILPNQNVCQVVREAIYNGCEITDRHLEEEKIAVILEKIETDINNAFSLGFDIGRTRPQ